MPNYYRAPAQQNSQMALMNRIRHRPVVFKQLPWIGGLNTSQDESVIPPNQLTVCDNVVYDTRGSKQPRDGINNNYDSATAGSENIVGLHDYWFGSTAKTQRLIGVSDAKAVYSYNSGTRTTVTFGGQAWSSPITTASIVTYNNKVIIAVDGTGNSVKFWDGNASNPLKDLYSAYSNTAKTRSSSGTTRTLVFNQAFQGASGSTIVVDNCPNTAYNGTFTVASISTTTVTGDTITYTASSSLTEGSTSDTAFVVGQLAPAGSWLSVFQNRLIMNDKTNVDRFYYSAIGDHTTWWGWGDSGGFNIGLGDGDPDGLTAGIPFKGDFFFFKRTKAYRMAGPDPDDWSVALLSGGVGCISHAGVVPVDQDDVFFVSERGVHSLQSTASYGDFSSEFVSQDIQKTFNDSLNRARLKYCWTGYLPQVNSVGFALSSAGSGTNDQFYLYNIPLKAWYRWTGITAQSLCVANDLDKKRFYFGGSNSRISKSFNGTSYDVASSGATTAIAEQVTTGVIFPDGDPYSLKGFKRFFLYFKPKGAYQLNVSVTIDNTTLNPENSLSFTGTATGDLLGSTFVLGKSVLGTATQMLGPYSFAIDGVGRGVKISITQNNTNNYVELQGWGIEYEPLGNKAEVY